MKQNAAKIRSATAEDSATLITLLEQLFSIEADFSFDAQRQRHGLELLLNTRSATVQVAVEPVTDQVVGMVTGQLLVSTAEGNVSVLVEDLVVDRQWRGRGIGVQLLGAVSSWAEGHGARRLQLLADEDNTTALCFYNRNGWQRTRLVCLRRFQSTVSQFHDDKHA